MHAVAFLSNAPFSHLPRAMDLLRRMDFGLGPIRAEPRGGGEFLIWISFVSTSANSAETFADRLRQMHGLRILTCCRCHEHRDEVFGGAGNWECEDGGLAADSSSRW